MQTPTKKQHPAGVAAGANTRPNYATHDPLTEVTSRLKGAIKRHNGGLLTFCPSHDDRKGRSLAVSLGRQGQVLLHCFAGCSIHEITSAVDLNPADLFPHTESKYDPKTKSYFNEWQILESLRFDAMVVLIAARRVLADGQSTEADIDFLSKALSGFMKPPPIQCGVIDESRIES